MKHHKPSAPTANRPFRTASGFVEDPQRASRDASGLLPCLSRAGRHLRRFFASNVYVAPLIALFLLQALIGCQGKAHRQEQRKEVEATVRRYVKILPAVYKSGDPAVLDGVATIREQATIKNGMKALARHHYKIQASLVACQITYVDIFNESNAYVKTTERWNVRLFDDETGIEKGVKPGEILHVTYQLKDFMDEGWRVTSRIVQETKRQRQ